MPLPEIAASALPIFARCFLCAVDPTTDSRERSFVDVLLTEVSTQIEP